MFRYEFKYMVPFSRIDALRRRIGPFVQEDKFAGRRPDHQYIVRSIYYENTGYRSYEEKLAGIERRVKVRIRGYNQPEPESSVFLELKRKHGPFIRKNRAPVLWSELSDLLRDRDVERHVCVRRSFEQGKEDARLFFYQLIAKGMSPAILITYEREAYFATFDRRIRLTFDKHIGFRLTQDPRLLFDEKSLTPLFRNHFVFELKFDDSLPEWLIDVISEFNLQRQAVSKYALSLERAWFLHHGRHRRDYVSLLPAWGGIEPRPHRNQETGTI